MPTRPAAWSSATAATQPSPTRPRHPDWPFPEPPPVPDASFPVPEPAFTAPDDEPGSGQPPRSGNPLARLAGRASWNLIDQVLSTFTNALLAYLVAHRFDAFSAGAFSTAFLLFSLGIALARALTSQVLTIRYADAGPDEWPTIASRALGTVATLALPAGAALVGAGFLFGGLLKWPLIAVGVTLGPLLLQDTIRGIFFAQSRAQLAALNDTVWAVVQITVMLALIFVGRGSVGSLTLAWGLSAGVGVVVGAVQLKAFPNVGATRSWVREHGDLLGYLLPETLITSSGAHVAFLAIGAIVDLTALSAVNYARQFLTPLQIMTSALASFAMPEIARRVNLSASTRWRLGSGIAAAMGVAALIYLGAILLIPNSIGTSLFNETWGYARAVLLPMGLFSTLAGVCFGPFVVIAAMGHAKRTFRVTVLQTALTVTLMPTGAVLYGTVGAAWFLVIAKLIEAPFWFVTLRTAVRLGPVVRPDEEEDQQQQPASPSTSSRA